MHRSKSLLLSSCASYMHELDMRVTAMQMHAAYQLYSLWYFGMHKYMLSASTDGIATSINQSR